MNGTGDVAYFDNLSLTQEVAQTMAGMPCTTKRGKAGVGEVHGTGRKRRANMKTGT
ncbi:MAG: hypothetical protein ACLU9S_17445 [Oscillospiraceae bacterium]